MTLMPQPARNGIRSLPTWISTPASFLRPIRIQELAAKIVMKYQRVPMPPKSLEETVARYNSFVDAGKDEDFGKPTPKYKIARPPFYAAWATPNVHDARAGLADQCQMPGAGYEWPGDSGSLLRRRIRRRFQPARPGASHLSGLYRRQERCVGKGDVRG